MKEDFVTYEQAKTLKELGFDWECFSCYIKVYKGDDGWRLRIYDRHQSYNDERDERCISAPTLSQAQKWLRDVKGIIICIEPRFYRNKRPLVGYDYHLFNKDDGMFSHIESETIYDTYEEALSEAIDKVIEILKQENKI